jgi:hypothetical protein
MAGDGGRAPDVSEVGIRAAAEADGGWADSEDHARRTIAAYLANADPASVLAALLAEHPDATVAALETLLMGQQALRAAEQSLVASARSCLSDAEATTFALSAACRSLRPIAPKEDRDA